MFGSFGANSAALVRFGIGVGVEVWIGIGIGSGAIVTRIHGRQFGGSRVSGGIAPVTNGGASAFGLWPREDH